MTTNSLAFIALCNEYCATLEACATNTRHDFIGEMLRILPRIYISANDLPYDESSVSYIESALEEYSYNNICRDISAVMGDADSYLEVFEEDMKFSDTPIASSVSENLADLFQVFYNLLETVKDAPEEIIDEALFTVRDDFAHYWSQILCNVLRQLNNCYFNSPQEDE